jgi:hypothetical protein
MNDAKYIGLDVHQATISVAVLDAAGNLVMRQPLETHVLARSSLAALLGRVMPF